METVRTAGNGDLDDVIPLEPKRMALLAYLAVEGGTGRVTRDSVVGTFWPERSESAARSALRQALHYLSRRLEDGAITGRGRNQVGIDPRAIDCDVVRFERALASDAHAEAFESYGGEFLPGFYYSEMSTQFEDWMISRRRRFEILALRAALRLAEGEIERENWVEGIGWLRRALELAPFDESVLRRLLLALAQSDNRAGAAYEFSLFASHLRSVYGTEVSLSTSALADAVERGAQAKWREIERVRELRARLARETTRTRELVRQAQRIVQAPNGPVAR